LVVALLGGGTAWWWHCLTSYVFFRKKCIYWFQIQVKVLIFKPVYTKKIKLSTSISNPNCCIQN